MRLTSHAYSIPLDEHQRIVLDMTMDGVCRSLCCLSHHRYQYIIVTNLSSLPDDMVGSAEGSGQLTYTQVDAQLEYRFLAIVPLEMNI